MAEAFYLFLLCSVIQATTSLKCGPHRLCYCHKQKQPPRGIAMDCSNKQIHLRAMCSSIADHNDTRITELDASFNNMTRLNRSSLIGCENISVLIISSNHIEGLQENTFMELSSLTKLDLSHNDLTSIYFNVSKPLLSNLNQLRSLWLNGNYRKLAHTRPSYPRLSNLVSLETLVMDGLTDTSFGQDYLSLNDLVNLNLSGTIGYCDMGHLRNGTFENTIRLEKIDLSNCNLTNIDAGTFMPLNKLKWLDLSVNRRLGFRVLRNVSYALQFTQIDFLNYSEVRNTFGLGSVLKNRDVCYLRNTTLRSMALNRNKLELFEKNLPMLFPPTFQEIHMEDNTFTFGQYLLQFSCLANVTHVFANNQNHVHSPRLYSNDVDKINDVMTPLPEGCPFMSEGYLRNISKHIQNCPYFDTNKIRVLNFTLPPHFKTSYFSGCNVRCRLPKMTLYPFVNHIEHLDLSNNVMYSWIGPVGPLPHIKTLNLSRNYCAEIGDSFFSLMGSLETLDIGTNFIGIALARVQKGTPFKHLRNLKHLYMSINEIKVLPRDVFNHLKSLEVLDLSFNNIGEFSVSVEHLQNLSSLDLSNNALQTLPQELVHHFKEMYTNRGIKFSINLESNRLRCSCSNRLFLEWMMKHRHFFVNFDLYKFTDDTGGPIYSSECLNRMSNFGKTCRSYTPVIVTCTLGLSVFLSVVIGGFIYRHRWKLRYYLYMNKRRFYGYQRLQNENVENYKYDAFISYSDDNIGFILKEIIPNLENGDSALSLCVHQRDFLPGNAIADNIIEAIHSSRKTVVLLSKSFVKRTWCLYEFQMARMETIYSRDGQGCLIVAMLENVPTKAMPLEMVEWIKDESYIEFSHDGEGYELFWKNLKDAVMGIQVLE